MSKYCLCTHQKTEEVAEVQKIINPATFQMYTNPVAAHRNLVLEVRQCRRRGDLYRHLNTQGGRVFETAAKENNYVVEPGLLKRGSYIVKIKNSNSESTQTLIVQE